MVARPLSSKTRKHPSSPSRWGNLAAILAITLVAVVTVTSLRELRQLLDAQKGSGLGEAANTGDWHSVLGRAEKKLETHLPHWLSTDKAPAGIGAHMLQHVVCKRSINVVTAMHVAEIKEKVFSKVKEAEAGSDKRLYSEVKSNASTQRSKSAATCNAAPHTEYGAPP